MQLQLKLQHDEPDQRRSLAAFQELMLGIRRDHHLHDHLHVPHVSTCQWHPSVHRHDE